MKGISTVIATFLMLIIIFGLFGLAYYYITVKNKIIFCYDKGYDYNLYEIINYQNNTYIKCCRTAYNITETDIKNYDECKVFEIKDK